MGDINECNLNKFYKRSQIDLIVFSWVQCLKLNIPSISIEKAINQCLNYYEIEGDTGRYLKTYYRMIEEIRSS